MSYALTNSDGTPLTTVADGTIDTTSTGLSLPGPNYIGYGQFLNQNLINLLENFASNTAPLSSNQIGQLWFDKAHQILNVFTTTGYSPVSGILIDAVQPAAGFQVGTVWFNTTSGQVFIYTPNNQFELIGPLYTAQQGQSGAIPTVVSDANVIGLTHNLVELKFGNTVIGVFSTDAPFQPSPVIPGFGTISPGLTLNNTLYGGSIQFYANANVSAYLPLDQTIININSNIVTSNNAVVNYINSQVAILNAEISAVNVATNSASISSQFLAVNTAIISNNSSTNANIVTANNAVVAYVNTLISAMASNVAGANAAIVTANNAVVSYVNSLNTAMTSNINAANVNIATLQTQVYANANVAAYLPIYTGNLKAGNAFVSNSFIVGNGIVSSGIYTNTFIDGIAVDYATGNGRISVGAADGINIYNSGIGNTQIARFSSNGFHLSGNLLFAANIPTISSGFGTNASIIANNGSTIFMANIGLGGVATSGTIGLPVATTGWIAHVQVFNPTATNAMQTTLVNASSNVSITVTNYWTANGAITAWPANTALSFVAASY